MTTPQSQPLVDVQASLQTGGNTSPDPSQQGIQAAADTTSHLYGAPAKYQGYTSSPQSSASAALDFIGVREMATEILYLYIFQFTIEYNLVDYPQFNGNITKLITQVQQNVTTAIDSGAATVYLRNQAIYLGATEMKNATTQGAPFTYTILPVPASPHTANLTDGQVAGIVVGVVVGAILILALIYWLVMRTREKLINTDAKRQNIILNESDMADDSILVDIQNGENYSHDLYIANEEEARV